MAVLLVVKGPQPGSQLPLGENPVVLGRSFGCAIPLESLAVSRRHAQISWHGGKYYVEDLHSSNGTFLNGKRITDPVRLSEGDKLVVGPYHFTFRVAPEPSGSDVEVPIRETVAADPNMPTLRGRDSARQLQVMVEIGRHLASSLDLETLFGKLMDHLLGLFAQADRALIFVVYEGEPVLRAHRSRRPVPPNAYPYSRTVLRRVLDDKVAILSEDVGADQRLPKASTLESLQLLSLMCAPLLGQNGEPLGVVQVDCFLGGSSFGNDDLHLLNALAMQISLALENALHHADLLRQERAQHELALARQIQQGFLPAEFPPADKHGFELFARVRAAREVSGDLYDFFFLKDGRLAFLVGDVAGKGIPAALFMLAVRTHARHAAADHTPAKVLDLLNVQLSADNEADIFVSLIYGVYDPRTGETAVASAGHPAPLRRSADGKIEAVPLETGRILACDPQPTEARDLRLTLAPGETLIVYTDGFTEAHTPHDQEMFGTHGLKRELGGKRAALSLEECANQLEGAVQRFTQTAELQDDQTILLLRRVAPRGDR